jgi:hypothetical protein
MIYIFLYKEIYLLQENILQNIFYKSILNK